MAAHPKSRLPLSRDRILESALALADDAGIEAVTMRKLGQELGFEAMSLYNYVANKDELLDGILDLVLAEMELPRPEGDWHAAVRSSAVSVHEALRRHSWAAQLLLSPDRILSARLGYMDSLMGRLRQGGLSAETTYHAYHVLDGYIFGFSLWLTSHTFTDEQATKLAETFGDQITPEEYPHLHEHGQQHFDEGRHRDVSAFEFGLDLILDGLRRAQAAEAATA
jgi:AcrR family transcriptional regulator